MKVRSPVLAALILIAGCSPSDRAPATPAAGLELDAAAWTQELVEHRDETDEYFRSASTSPIAGAQRLTSESGERVDVTREDRAFALAPVADPTAEMTLVRAETTWTWERLGKGVTCEVDEEPAAAGSDLAGPASCDVAGLHLSLYPSEDSVTFIVYDPERSEKTAFEHLLYYPPDRTYAVQAELVRLVEPEEIEMLTSRSLKKTFYRYATIRFPLDGEDQELSAFKSTLEGEGSESLFIPFRDATSGRETYGAGRFLDLEEPEGGRFVLDFNRAYNPLCNYSPAFNCPIPPRENRLAVAIPAGERTYPH